MSTHMHIRPATTQDVPGVLPMVQKIVDKHTAMDTARFATLDDVVDRYARWLPQRVSDERSVFLVAEDETLPALAGFIIAGIEENVPIYRVDEFGFVFDLWVEPQYRRGGVARALMLETLRRFERIGVKQVRLETAAPNEAARKLFASLGFRVGSVDMLKDL